MAIDPKGLVKRNIDPHLTKGGPQTVSLGREDKGRKEVLTLRRGGDGEIDDVSYECSGEGSSVSLHENEVIISYGGRADLHYYMYDEKGEVAHAARLFTTPDGLVKTTGVDEDMRLADQGIIDSARKCYFDALENPKGFEIQPIFDEEDILPA